jgi:hydroxypyruvate isomerase
VPRLAANLSMMFTEVPFLDRFALARAHGFEAVEFLFPYEHTPADIKARLTAHGLTQALFNLPPGDWAAGERGLATLPGRQAEFRDSVARALDYAAALDCRLLHCMAGIPPADLPRATAAALYAANLAHAAEQAGAAGVRLTLEPINARDMPGYFLSSQAEGAAIAAAFGADRVGLQFDLYHCQISEGDITTRMARYLDVIAHMQIADVPGRHEPGTGEIGWDYVFGRIDALGYTGWVGCEYRPAGATAEGLGWRTRYGV